MAKKTGNIHMIRAVLKSGDMTAEQISRVTGITALQVRNAIQSGRKCGDNAVYTVGAVLIGKSRFSIYSINKPFKEAVQLPDRPRRYVPEFREMTEQSYDLYAARNLAMLAR